MPSPSAFAVDASTFWLRHQQFSQCRESLMAAKKVSEGWDGYDAPPPNERAVSVASDVITEIQATSLNPSAILPSADGGIGIAFRGAMGKRAALEVLNNGSLVYTMYGASHQTQQGETTYEGLSQLLMQIQEYL